MVQCFKENSKSELYPGSVHGPGHWELFSKRGGWQVISYCSAKGPYKGWRCRAVNFGEDFPLTGMNDSASCKERTLKCHNPSASNSFCNENSGPWKLSCFHSSGGEAGASWTPSAFGVLEGAPRDNKEPWILRLKFPNWDLSDPTVQTPTVCIACKQLQFKEDRDIVCSNVIWFPLFTH